MSDQAHEARAAHELVELIATRLKYANRVRDVGVNGNSVTGKFGLHNFAIRVELTTDARAFDEAIKPGTNWHRD